MRVFIGIIGAASFLMGLLTVPTGLGNLQQGHWWGVADLVAGLLFLGAAVLALPPVQRQVEAQRSEPLTETTLLRWEVTLALVAGSRDSGNGLSRAAGGEPKMQRKKSWLVGSRLGRSNRLFTLFLGRLSIQPFDCQPMSPLAFQPSGCVGNGSTGCGWRFSR